MLFTNKHILGNLITRNGARCLTLALLLFTGVAFAKTDVIIFKNGDRLTGEVKSLDRGRLRFKTDATDTINIEWDEVAYLQSDQNIQVETILGLRYLGQLVPSEEKFNVIVETNAKPVTLNNVQIIKMTPIEERGVNRFDGDITAGYNFTKANEVLQLNLGVDLNYRTEVRILSLDLSAALTESLDNAANQRETLHLDYTRLLKNRWLRGGGVTLERNDELGIDQRSSIRGSGGRILRQSDHSAIILEGGLMATKEELTGATADENTIEAFGTLSWDWYRYDAPELDLSSSFQVIPNLSDTGRVRGELDISLKWEMIEDLFWGLTYYHSYDNRPATLGAEKSDYGVITSLGYDF